MTKTINRALAFVAAALILAGCGETGRIFGFERGGPDEFTVVRNPPLSVPPQATLRPPSEDSSAVSRRDASSEQARASLIASGGEKAGSAGTLVTDEGVQPYDGGNLPPRQATESSPWYQPSQVATEGATGSSTGSSPTDTDGSAIAGGTYPQAGAAASPRRYGAGGVPIIYNSQSAPSRGEAALAQRVTSYYGVEPGIRRKVDAESAELALEQEKFLHKVLFWKDPEPPGTPLDANAEARRLQENEALGKPVNAGEAPLIARKQSGISSLF